MKDVKELQHHLVDYIELKLNTLEIPYRKEECGGDYLYVVCEDTNEQFTVEVCYDSTDFFPINQWYHAREEDYLHKVIYSFDLFLKPIMMLLSKNKL